MLRLELYLTYRCNLACWHCYLPAARRRARGYMPLGLVQSAAAAVAAWAHSHKQTVGVDLIGGEPTLLPDAYLCAAARQVRDAFSGHDMSVQLGLATNLTRDLPDALPSRFDSVITSYDPGSRMRGRRAQFEAWALRVRTSAAWSTPLTVSVTLTRELLTRWEPGALLDYLLDGLGVHNVQFEPFALQGEGARHRELLEPAPHAVAAFLAAALAWRRERPSVGLSTLATFAEDLAALAGNQLRANPPSLAIAVDPSGHTWSCERVGVGKPLGHINTTPLSEILDVLRPGVAGKLHASRACISCAWLRLCARGHRQSLGLDCKAMRSLCADQAAVAGPIKAAA